MRKGKRRPAAVFAFVLILLLSVSAAGAETERSAVVETWGKGTLPKKTFSYEFGTGRKYIPYREMRSWICAGEDGLPSYDREKVKAYVEDLAREYDTAWVDRVFVSDDGTEYAIPAGINTYGFCINVEKETDSLIYDLTQNPDRRISRRPVYSQEGMTRDGKDDLCGSYVEVNLSKQEVACFRNGILIDRTYCVSGNESAGTPSDEGTFYIYDKQQNTVLHGYNADGTEYNRPVSYWMPYNGGEGLHDAVWRGEFGGDIYVWGGSHGCINLRLDDAKAVYENVSIGTPVIVHR